MLEENPISIPEIPLPTGHRFINLIGQKFGRLTVIAYAGQAKNLHAKWYCRCDCGHAVIVQGPAIKRGETVSCGCYMRERMKAYNASRDAHRQSGTLTYKSWQAMRQRCYSTNHLAYYRYGGRGIMVCERWRDSFENFLADMGERPSTQYSLDRIDVNGNYEPGNCRWATRKEQCRNTRSNVMVTYEGVTACIAEHCERLGVDMLRVWSRLKHGWSLERAFTEPIRKHQTHCKHGHPLSGRNLIVYTWGAKTKRKCRACSAANDLRYKAERRRRIEESNG